MATRHLVTVLVAAGAAAPATIEPPWASASPPPWAARDAATEGRRLDLAQFNGITLSPLALTNAPGSSLQEMVLVTDVLAGVPYAQLILHATSSLTTDHVNAHIQLMLSSTTKDADCLPGGDFIAPACLPEDVSCMPGGLSLLPSTSLDGKTSAKYPARVNENKWGNVRFPYSGNYKTCYYNGAIWLSIPVNFNVKGAESNMQKFWCVASTAIDCRMAISGIGVKSSWLLTVLDYAEPCGDSRSPFHFGFNVSIGTKDPDVNTRIFHTLGKKADAARATYRVCYCPGYRSGVDSRVDPCTEPEDFVQLAGLLYVTRVSPPQDVYPVLRVDLMINCGDNQVGGCPLSQDMRFRLVDPASHNNDPAYYPGSGCKTAPESTHYLRPPNCETPLTCGMVPSVIDDANPKWNDIRLRVAVDNHAQLPTTLDVCFCYEDCSDPYSWFKVDDIRTKVIEVRPQPMIAGQNTDFELYAPNGGWNQQGHTHEREMKFLYDPEGTVSSDDCYQDPQDNLFAVAGHFCYSLADCKSPTTSSNDGHVWNDVKIKFAGMYAICYCDFRCAEKDFWSFLKWHLVAGPYSKQVWSFSRGISFDLTVSGWGLQQSNRLRIIAEDKFCGEVSATSADGVRFSSSASPVQKGDLTGFGVIRIVYVYDGSKLLVNRPHKLQQDDYISLSGLYSPECPACASLLNERPHKVIRVISPTEVVIPVFYGEFGFPVFQYSNATWVHSNLVVFQNLFGLSPATYRVCWGNAPTSDAAAEYAAAVGTLTIFEPPVFKASLHMTAAQSNVIAPIVFSFETRSDQKYQTAQGDMQFRITFRRPDRVAPGVTLSASLSVVPVVSARQNVCGRIFKELWSSDADGFPMPKGCFNHDDGTTPGSYSILLSAKNGLKGAASYQIVMDARVRESTLQDPYDGVVQLWSMEDVDASHFGVIEFAPVWPDKTAVQAAGGSNPQFLATEGLSIVAATPEAKELDLPSGTPGAIPLRLAAKAGSPITPGTLLRVFLWPLTQWDVGDSCVVSCQPYLDAGIALPMKCDPPSCSPEAVGYKRNVMKLTFSSMDIITDSVRHTVVLSNLPLPAGGFFATALAGELQKPEGESPSYARSTGALIFVRPTAAGSVVSHFGSGDESPFRGDQGNMLYIRITMGAALWSAQSGDANFEVMLPPGYVCVAASPAGTNVLALQGKAPQGRGDVGMDPYSDGFWLLSGQSCTYRLLANSVIYAGSAIFVRLMVNNPVFVMPRDHARNVWTVQPRARGAPFMPESTMDKVGQATSFTDMPTLGEHFRRNVAVLGKLVDATLSPMLLGAGQNGNWISVFFKTEQATPSTAPRVELRLPNGFGLLPQCRVEPLPDYHYATLSSALTGLTVPTYELEVVQCTSSRSTGSVLNDRAALTVSNYVSLQALTTYGFRIEVHNAATYVHDQQDGFSLTTMTTDGDGLDSTYFTMRFLAADGEGPYASFGVYRLPMADGTYVVGLGNMLPYSATGLTATCVIFPLRVPFDLREAVDWRLVAPYGYEWDFVEELFQYRMTDILGSTADLPIDHKPDPPSLPPKNVLAFVNNFLGEWNQMQTYGLITDIRVPDATPTSSTNTFFIEFGYSASTANGRFAGAGYGAPQVRALVNGAVDFQDTNLAGQQNRLFFQVETVTNLMTGGGIVIETPKGFVFQERCVVLVSPMRVKPFQDLSTATPAVCTSEVPFTTNKPLVTISVVSGEIRAAAYEFMIDAQNPQTAQDALAMTWTISTFSNIGLVEVADLSATLGGFAVESPMLGGELVKAVDYTTTRRDDHPLQESFVVLAFQLDGNPSFEVSDTLTVKAPLGFTFPGLCVVIVGSSVFGQYSPYPSGYYAFQASATVTNCVGTRNKANMQVRKGLQNLKTYALRIGVINPASTPQYNTWTIRFAGESTVPFTGYKLWAFTEVQILSSHTARSTLVEETKSVVSIRFRPTNSVTMTGMLAISAPFGYSVPTDCTAVLLRLNPLSVPIAVVPNIECKGRPQPTNDVELHITDLGTQIQALQLQRLELEVVNPSQIPADPGSWRLLSYQDKSASYAQLLDVGEAQSFVVTEVFYLLLAKYPPYVSPFDNTLDLEFQIVLWQAVDLGDAIQLTGPEGYDFAVATDSLTIQLEFRACGGFVRITPDSLPTPRCLANTIRLVFKESGLALVRDVGLTPLMAFKIQTVYPRKTLVQSENVIHGEHFNGEELLSSKTIPAQSVTPRLQGLKVERLDAMVAVESTSNVKLSFSPSQDAGALEITSGGTVAAITNVLLRFKLLGASVTGTVENMALGSIQVAVRSNATLFLEMELLGGLSYTLTLEDVVNPSIPGKAVWTLASFGRPVDADNVATTAPLTEWAVAANRLDRVQDLVGPPTFSRLTINPVATVLAQSFFDVRGTELTVAFRCSPGNVPAGQYLILFAPYGYEFIDKTFQPGNGFPVVSGSVFAAAPGSISNGVGAIGPGAATRLELWRYAIQILTLIQANQLIQFAVRVSTPSTPEELATWETETSPNWLLLTAQDPDASQPSTSNDNLFTGFSLLASFGDVAIVPEPGGETPKQSVVVTVVMNPRTTFRSLLDGGSIYVRVVAPVGFDFLLGCLAVTPNPVFSACYGNGRIAVLPVRKANLAAGRSTADLSLTNAGMTPAQNTWVLESFVDLKSAEEAKVAVHGAKQYTAVEGYQIRELIQATIGANSQKLAVTMVYVWFIATNFIDIGGALELHAPPGLQMRCDPRVVYISLPPGSCTLTSGVTSTSGDSVHDYVTLTLTVPDRQILPNTAYEFAVMAVNPESTSTPNFWGILFRNDYGEVVDSTMTLNGYELTDYQVMVNSLLASSLTPAVVNYVRLTMTFEKDLAAGLIGHISIMAPSTTKVLCQQFVDESGGGSVVAMLPLDPDSGAYRTHDCALQNSITLHVLSSKPLLTGTYILRLGVLNPGLRAVEDYWSVNLLPGLAAASATVNTTTQASTSVSSGNSSYQTGYVDAIATAALVGAVALDWRTAPPLLRIRVGGFGVSSAFTGPAIIPVLEANGPCKRHGSAEVWLLLLVLLLRAF